MFLDLDCHIINVVGTMDKRYMRLVKGEKYYILTTDR